jgi:hypothetical protein
MEERLRAAALIIRSDLENDHFESGVRLGDPNFWRLGNPRQGFLNITQGFTATSSSPGTTVAAAPLGPPQPVVPLSMTSANGTWTIQPGSVLLIEAGTGAAEYVLVQSVPNPTTFTAVFQNMHPSTAGTSFSIQYIRQYEGNDADGLPVSRATDHVLYLAVKKPGDRPENFFTAHLPYGLPYQSPAYPVPTLPGPICNPFFATRWDGLPNPNYAPTTFGDQATDARFQDLLPPIGSTALSTIGYKTQWAEVAYFLWPNGTFAHGTPLYALYRAEFKVVPDSRYLNGQVFGMAPSAPLPPPPIASSFTPATGFTGLPGLALSWNNDGFKEMSCKLSPTSGPPFTYFFNTPSDLAGSNPTGSAPVPPSRAFTANVTIPLPGPGGTMTTVPARAPFSPSIPDTWSATLIATDVVSFDVQIAPGGPALSPGGMLATSELPWASPNTVGVPALSVLPTGTNDFVDIPTGSFDTALTTNQYSINAIRVILRVWNTKTEQTRQVSIIQQL